MGAGPAGAGPEAGLASSACPAHPRLSDAFVNIDAEGAGPSEISWWRGGGWGAGRNRVALRTLGTCGARVGAGRGVPGQEEVSGTRGSWPGRCWVRQARLSPLLTPSPDPWEGGRTGGAVDRAPFLLRRMKGEAGYSLVLVAYWLPVITALGLSFLSLCQGLDPVELSTPDTKQCCSSGPQARPWAHCHRSGPRVTDYRVGRLWSRAVMRDFLETQRSLRGGALERSLCPHPALSC